MQLEERIFEEVILFGNNYIRVTSEEVEDYNNEFLREFLGSLYNWLNSQGIDEVN